MGMSLEAAKTCFGDRAFAQIERELNKNKCSKKQSKPNQSQRLKKLKEYNPAEVQLELLLKQVFEPKYTVIRHAKGLIPGREYEADFYIPELNTIFEMDGWEFHGKYKDSWQHDRERDQIFTIHGIQILRFFYKQVMSHRQIPETIRIMKRYLDLHENE